ncbi:hypothetical protein H0E87_006862, partial [Populus deltoides]
NYVTTVLLDLLQCQILCRHLKGDMLSIMLHKGTRWVSRQLLESEFSTWILCFGSGNDFMSQDYMAHGSQGLFTQ